MIVFPENSMMDNRKDVKFSTDAIGKTFRNRNALN